MEADTVGYSYIDEPEQRLDTVLVSYSNFLKKNGVAVRSTEAIRERKWNKNLTGKKDEVLAKPFPTFITCSTSCLGEDVSSS